MKKGGREGEGGGWVCWGAGPATCMCCVERGLARRERGLAELVSEAAGAITCPPSFGSQPCLVPVRCTSFP